MKAKLPTRAEDYSAWYNEIILRAQLAETSPVRGCMIIKPYGWAIWERMQRQLDDRFKETGHENAYFPLFIPKSFLSREADHVEGFAKECAVVTHYRLKSDDEGGVVVDPEAKLEEELIVRPTSETIIWSSYRNWIQSYRDLPLLINQWANVVRWEMRTRLFLRTTEFLWQEGHTAHATAQEAIAETEQMLEVYAEFARNMMAMPVIRGVKTPSERFAGAVETYCIEALMQDGRALQAGTSHFLGQNFAKAFDCQFTNRQGQLEYVWGTSWGVSTRLMGALVMAHSDDKGLVVPPRLAPIQVVLIPIYKGESSYETLNTYGRALQERLRRSGLTSKLDDRDTQSPGFKFNEYELKGVPVRVAFGLRDLEAGTLEIVRRDTLEKSQIKDGEFEATVLLLMSQIQQGLYDRALARLEASTHVCDDYDALAHGLEEEGGFYLIHLDTSTPEAEERLKQDLKATVRCLPLDDEPTAQLGAGEGLCLVTGRPSPRRVLVARAY